MMKGKDRNAPCWCGSGKKYKKCHLDRESQQSENPWAAVEANRKAFTQKKCYASGAGLGPCKGGVIKAHTISRSANLIKIAEESHVLRYAASIPELRKNGGKLSVERIGVKEASVFFGFCSKHDRELFSCIENEPFVGRPDQCLSVAYRTMSRELYGKDAAAHMRETLRGADKGKSVFEQILLQRMLDHMKIGNDAARSEAAVTHSALTKAIIDGKPEIISSLILEFDAPLPFMFAGAWSPFTDLYGQQLQNGLAEETLDQVFFSSFALASGAMICISWRIVDGSPGKVIADQIEALSDTSQASACLQIVAKHIENVFYNPGWFENLDSKQRKQLEALTISGIDFLGSIPSAPIKLEQDFNLPATWKVFHV